MSAIHAGSRFYIIKIREKLDGEWEEWFDGMSIHRDDDGTTLTGELPDQAALHGMIARVHRLGLQLIAVNESDWHSHHNERER